MRSFDVSDGRSVLVGGRRLWADRSGHGSPAVVFLPGAGGIGLDFQLVHDRIASVTTSVIYDRAGTGSSDDIELPRRADDVIDELVALLEALDVDGSWVPVGHSLGGLYAQRLAQRFPDRTAAMVLLDPVHEDYDAYMPEHLRLATYHSRPDSAEPVELTDEFIALGRAQLEAAFGSWPADVRDVAIERHLDPSRLMTGFHEAGHLLADLEQLGGDGPRPRVPIQVLTAGGTDSFQRAFASDSDLDAQIAGTERLARAIAATGTPGAQRTFSDVSHAVLPMREPEAIAAAITTALEHHHRA